MQFNFPTKKGTGIADLIPHISKDAQDLILKLLIYNPDNRITATQALKHNYFKDLRDTEAKSNFSIT
jgi:renal tumor antigen